MSSDEFSEIGVVSFHLEPIDRIGVVSKAYTHPSETYTLDTNLRSVSACGRGIGHYNLVVKTSDADLAMKRRFY